MTDKPSIGLMPKSTHDCQRLSAIKEAFGRYTEALEPIPVEWVQEYNELIKSLRKHWN